MRSAASDTGAVHGRPQQLAERSGGGWTAADEIASPTAFLPREPTGVMKLSTVAGVLGITPIAALGTATGRLGGRTVTYAGPHGSAMKSTLLPWGLETSLTLPSPRAGTEFEWRVSLPGALVQLVPTEAGGINVAVLDAVPDPVAPAGSIDSGAAEESGNPRPGSDREPEPPNARPVGSNRPPPTADINAGGASQGSALISGPTLLENAALAGHRSATSVVSAADAANLTDRQLFGPSLGSPAPPVRTERIVATVLPPTATDARGHDVPVTLATHGNVVTMTIAPKDDVSYPIDADPSVVATNVGVPCSASVQAGVLPNGSGVLVKNCRLWQALGFNDYRLMNYAAPNPFVYPTGCGAILNSEDQSYELDRIRESGADTIRVWFFQKYFQDYKANNPGAANGWYPYIKLLKKAKADGLSVIPVLVNNWNQCDREDSTSNDGNHVDGYFYADGYRSPQFNYTYSAKTWASMVAKEFSPSTTDANAAGLSDAIAFFQIVNEAEFDATTTSGAVCGDNAAKTLYAFGQDMATTIKSAYVGSSAAAPPLVSLGTMAIGQCGVSSAASDPVGSPNTSDFQYIHSAPAIDICEIHDYDAQDRSDPTYNWYGLPNNNLAQRITECGGKPVVIGEAGIEANVALDATTRVDRGSASPAPTNYTTLKRRAQYLSDKIATSFNSGVSGYVLWDKIMASSDSAWNVANDETLGYGAYGIGGSGGTKSQDPAVCVLRGYATAWTLGEPPLSASGSCGASAWPVAIPGPADHYAFVDGTPESWGKNAGGWGNLGTAYSGAADHGNAGAGPTGGVLDISVGTGPVDTGSTTVTFGTDKYNPYSEIEVESDSVALLVPGSTVSFWVNNRATGSCTSQLQVRPVLRLNGNWDSVRPVAAVTMAASTWQQVSFTVPATYGSANTPVTAVHAVGVEIDAPGQASGINCKGQHVFLDDAKW